MSQYKNAVGEEGNEKPTQQSHFHRNNLRISLLDSAILEIEYATWLKPDSIPSFT